MSDVALHRSSYEKYCSGYYLGKENGMKRLLPYLLSAALILTVSGCGSSRDTVEREIQDIQQDQAGAEESVSKPEASDPDSSAQETSKSDSSMQEQEPPGRIRVHSPVRTARPRAVYLWCI